MEILFTKFVVSPCQNGCICFTVSVVADRNVYDVYSIKFELLEINI